MFKTNVFDIFFFCWCAIYLCLRFLLPIIYPAMYLFITRKGMYKCIKEVGKFKEGCVIEILETENIHGTYKYVDQDGNYESIYYGYLITNFAPI